MQSTAKISLVLLFILYGFFKFLNLSNQKVNHSLKLLEYQVIPVEKLILLNGSVSRRHLRVRLLQREEENMIKMACHGKNWHQIYKPCLKNHEWSQRELNKNKRTDLNSSKIKVIVKPLGHPSSVQVITKDVLGRKKDKGGDSWRVTIKGRNYSTGFHLQDRLDGSYEGTFLVRQEGEFVLKIFLEYSLCDGVRDPPPDWFAKGTIQGKFQKQERLGKLDDFLHKGSRDIPFTIQKLENIRPIVMSPDKDKSCFIVNNQRGYWKQGNFHTHYDDEVETKRLFFRHRKKVYDEKLNTLAIYGDSMGNRFLKSLNKTGVCSNLFRSCYLAYIWIYKQEGVKDAHVYDGKDFNASRFINDIRIDILAENMRTNKSFLVINFGLHVIMAIPFHKAKGLFQSFLKMVRELRNEHGLDKIPRIIWKTTTPPMPEAHEMHIAHLRFLTRQRMYLWNAYTISEACKANIPVLDVYNMALSSDGKGLDIVHYNDTVFWTAEYQLISYILNTL